MGHKGKHYPDDFRRKAAALGAEIGPTKAAERLGINGNTMKSWMANGVKHPGMKRIPSAAETALIRSENENRKLKKEIEELKSANAILKEISIFFSKDRLSSNLSRSEPSPKKTKK